jgi:hypothetical protein
MGDVHEKNYQDALEKLARAVEAAGPPSPCRDCKAAVPLVHQHTHPWSGPGILCPTCYHAAALAEYRATHKREPREVFYIPAPPESGWAACEEGLGFWGQPPREDTRSRDLISVESGRVVLHLDESETHTGLLSGDALVEQLHQLSADCPSEGILDATAYNEWVRVKRGWPLRRDVLVAATERTNLALAWKESGARGAAHGGEVLDVSPAPDCRVVISERMARFLGWDPYPDGEG